MSWPLLQVVTLLSSYDILVRFQRGLHEPELRAIEDGLRNDILLFASIVTSSIKNIKNVKCIAVITIMEILVDKHAHVMYKLNSKDSKCFSGYMVLYLQTQQLGEMKTFCLLLSDFARVYTSKKSHYTAVFYLGIKFPGYSVSLICISKYFWDSSSPSTVPFTKMKEEFLATTQMELHSRLYQKAPFLNNNSLLRVTASRRSCHIRPTL